MGLAKRMMEEHDTNKRIARDVLVTVRLHHMLRGARAVQQRRV